jgi:hypothetical protein
MAWKSKEHAKVRNPLELGLELCRTSDTNGINV